MDTPDQRPPSGTQWTISSGGHEAVIVEVGGGLRTYRHDGVEYVDGYAEDEVCPGCAGQVLAPWPNRIRDGRYTFGERSHQLPLSEPQRHVAIHGLVNWVPWRLLEQSADAVTVGYDLPPQPGYPWALRLVSRWSVGPGGLRAEHEVRNPGGEAAPFGFAPHPYLQLPGVAVDDLVMRLPTRTRMVVDSRLLPVAATEVAGTEYDWTSPRRIGAARLDLTFGEVIRDDDGGSAVSLAAPDGSAGVTIWADREFGWWQVFTGDALTGDRHRRSVAIEPMTCPPDAFRSGKDVIALKPGATWRGVWGVRPGA
ncbi:aldose 1-epimerase family protein [Micromonospora sp. WMMD812]|uniref:aldose 1-epimerase family protein n=1 Tax=Micromonospora sp. WMMD812 TaxID=3015152 RepID=UPI00248BE29F|nr:aldose 1-epimerase family protein [Micromonospora sp. WMMD812]WBB65313.1 aldose 1-epimerase family protein [Micromonospora sp. WMMD812]